MNYLQANRLVIYDFDDTLCQSDGLVEVTNNSTGEILELSAREYTNFRENNEYQEGIHDLNFDQFRGMPINGRRIEWTFKRLLKDLMTNNTLVALVTGRDELKGPKQWLEEEGIETGNIILMCSGSPDKTFCYESLIANVCPTEIELYEDGYCYAEQLAAVCHRHGIPMEAYIISEDILKNENYPSASLLICR